MSASLPSANFINSAVVGVRGDLADKEGLRAATAKADYASVRGPYRYDNNHLPLQNFYLQETVKKADGGYEIKTVATILKDHPGPLARQVPDKVGLGARHDHQIRVLLAA